MPLSQWVDRIPEYRDTILFTVGHSDVTVGHAAASLSILALTMLSAQWIGRGVSKALQKRGLGEEDSPQVYARTARVTVLGIGAMAALAAAGLDLSAIFAAGGLFAVGAGFAMRNVVENFISGIILRIERSIKRGDIVGLEGERMVRIKDIGIRSTIARDRDDRDIIIPNTNLVQSNVINYTFDDRLFRIRISVGVSYSSDMKLVRRVLQETAEGISFRSSRRQPRVLMDEFGGSSVNWSISIWTESAWQSRQHRSDFLEVIWQALADAKITIAFPQLDVHFDQPRTSG